jgi:glycosyltransferase involved in cell wall biosynthesis
MRMPDLTSPINHKDLSYRKGCLYLGRLHAKKGIENLIEAIDITNDYSITLTIAGSGEKKYIEKLQSIIRLKNLGDRITFIGHVEGDRKATLYKTHKMLILPSFSENFGNVVVEALSFATPVISSQHTPWQEIECEKCGFWIDNSPSSLADAIIKINNMSDFDYQQMSINAYHFSRDRYDIKTKGPALKQIVIQLFS